MNNDSHPKADALRAMREARFGRIQATAEPPKVKVAAKPQKKKGVVHVKDRKTGRRKANS